MIEVYDPNGYNNEHEDATRFYVDDAGLLHLDAGLGEPDVAIYHPNHWASAVLVK